MKIFVTILVLSLSIGVLAQEAVVDVKARPALSFKATSKDVKGFAIQKGDEVEAKNIVVGLKKIDTGLDSRDEHTRNKYLEVEKFPEAVLVSAKGKGGKGEGIIRIKGIEKPISGTYKVEGGKLKADFPIKFSDFGITGIKHMGLGVDDNGMIHVTVPVQSAAAAPSARAATATGGKAPASVSAPIKKK